jgi:hypothetical protein
MIIQQPDGTYIYLPLPTDPWYRVVLRLLRTMLVTYQQWNALFLHPQQYGTLPHCYASLQHVRTHAGLKR